MNTETFDQFLQLSRELQRQAIEEEHARELEILDATDKLVTLIPVQISSLKRRLEVLYRMLEAGKMIKNTLADKADSVKHEIQPLDSRECTTDLPVDNSDQLPVLIVPNQSSQA